MMLSETASASPPGPAWFPSEPINALGLDLLARLAPMGNAVLSPFSIQSALAMAYAGADGVTRDEMRRVLHYPADETQLHAGFAALRAALDDIARRSGGGFSDPITLTLANGLFAEKTHSVHPAFLELVRRHYGASPQEMDFVADADGARREINAWIEGQTGGRFRNLSPSIDPLTRLVLVNAIYVKAPWADPFREGDTQPRPFHVYGGAPRTRPTMLRQAYCGYRKGRGYSAVTIPYTGGELHLLVLVPDTTDGLAAVERSLTAARLRQLAAAASRKVLLYLPKFRFEPPLLALRDALMELGMPTAFDRPTRSANFERMAPRHGERYLFLADVCHQTFFALDEKGTEATATTLIITPQGAVPTAKPIELKVDRPFLFAVQHRASGACLFFGRVSDPG